MRRAELRRMEIQNNQRALLLAHLTQSQFAQKLLGIPMFKAACDTAGDAYVKVKDSNALVGKSIELALNISNKVVDKLAPIAEKGITAASPLTTKVDDFAAKSLDGLIARVPVINEQPREIVENTKLALEKPVNVINGYTEMALKTWPVQSAMDVYETILTAACNTLDSFFPATKEEKEQNGLPTKESLGEQEKHKRGIVLAQRTYLMFTTAFKRVFGICQTQCQNAAQATDLVYKQVRNAVGDVAASVSPSQQPSTTTTSNNDANNVLQNNGEANKGNKKGKNKKNNQEQ